LEDIREDSQWLNRMVENLLSVTRVDAEQVRLSKHSVVLEELIDALLVKFYKHDPNQKLQVNMANIRKKLGCQPGETRYIINELGVGYRMPDQNE